MMTTETDDTKPAAAVGGQNELLVMRYFFFSYNANSETRFANGNIWMEQENFPSNAELKAIAGERNPGLDVVISGWQEFRSKEDYDAFRGA